MGQSHSNVWISSQREQGSLFLLSVIQHYNITCWGKLSANSFSLVGGYNITLCIILTKFAKTLWLDCLWPGALIILSILPPWFKWASFNLLLIWSLMIPWSVRADSVLEVDGDPLINNSRCPLWLLPSSLLLFWDILKLIQKKIMFLSCNDLL